MSVLAHIRNIGQGVLLLLMSLLVTTQVVWGQDVADSLEFIVKGDTLRFKKVYTLEFPEYTPLSDTLKSDSESLGARTKQTDSDIAATGSISRGIQVSSNASVSLQSSLYLKIKGSLGDQYTVSGVLTEKTSPLQPIGNTRRLNDFDRVLVTVDGPALTASIGDIDLRRKQGRFGKLDRSIEGIDFQARSGLAQVNTTVGFSYGQYYLQQIQGKDGKQGPYRLSGKSGEKFIIVIAGSEKVKIDDQLLQRGEHDDYIIDYNAAEITFTQKRILSSNSRISVEFEYVPDIYLASYSFGKQLISSGFSLGNEKTSPFYLSASWQELKDDQSNPLGNIDADLLSDTFGSLSDTTATTWISGVVADSITGSYVLDSDGVLVYAGEGLGDYGASFSFVGLSQGKYRKVLDLTLDYFVFDTLQGEYLPSQKLIAPQSHSVLSILGRASNDIFAYDLDFGVSRKINNLYANSTNSMDQRAWDMSLSANGSYLQLLLGDKYYEKDFVAYDALESIEYYRQWQLSPRISEEEHLNYAQFRVGKLKGDFLKGQASRLQRSGNIIGQQIQVDAASNGERPFQVSLNSVVTERQGNISQQHKARSLLKAGGFKTELHLGVEDANHSQYFQANDHVTSGLGFFYDFKDNHKVALHYTLRQDYRLLTESETFLSKDNIAQWTDQRQDWAAEYDFKEFVNTSGTFLFKYRQHQNDSSKATTYTLGNVKLNSKAIDDRFRYQGQYIIDEEHIPKYDFQYVQVDTGYGDYSYDPFIRDYIPLSGGRFIRQRVFSDVEEQVRKFDNKTRFEFVTHSFGKKDKIGVKSRITSETRSKLQVDTDVVLQNQSLNRLDIDYQTGKAYSLSKISYAGKVTSTQSALYNYGTDSSGFVSHELSGLIRWDPSHTTKLGALVEERNRDVEYNPLAKESWISYRPYGKHTYVLSPKQKMMLELKYSKVSDQALEQNYSEVYMTIDHNLRVRRRGRIGQKILVSNIQSDVTGIPYSIFSGRQPGNNWKYTFNGQYTFSNRFQLSLNYSIQERGEGRTEQYLRLEGRTHF